MPVCGYFRSFASVSEREGGDSGKGEKALQRSCTKDLEGVAALDSIDPSSGVVCGAIGPLTRRQPYRREQSASLHTRASVRVYIGAPVYGRERRATCPSSFLFHGHRHRAASCAPVGLVYRATARHVGRVFDALCVTGRESRMAAESMEFWSDAVVA